MSNALELIETMLAIPGPSGQEAAVQRFIVDQLIDAGADRTWIKTDDAQRRTPIDGECGNLCLCLPGTIDGPRRLLMAHMDTVPICVGCKPVRSDNMITSADPATGLGADNRSGCAVILNAALRILRDGLPHPPLTFLWTIQEEIGLQGARHVDVDMLGAPELGFNFDGGSPNKLTIGATGAYRLNIDIDGIASHAGVRPSDGVSSITVASMAIAKLQADGYLGRIEQPEGKGTANIGTIHGGQATNVLAPKTSLTAEIRSHDSVFRKRVLDRFQSTFEEAVASVTNAAGEHGCVHMESRLDYESFALDDRSVVIQVAEDAVRAVGKEPFHAITDGGIDPNWLNLHGVPTVSFGAGQVNFHTVHEALDIQQFLEACDIAMKLATFAT